MVNRIIADLSPEQIASKFALPAVPTQFGKVTIPAGTRLQASVANGILRGNNAGGGGVPTKNDLNGTTTKVIAASS